MSDKFNFKNKKVYAYLVIAELLVATAIILTVNFFMDKEDTTYASSESDNECNAVVSSEIKEYISRYYEEQEVNRTITDSEMEQITAHIVTNVLNNMSTGVSETDMQTIRDMIQNSVLEAIYENNIKIEKSYITELNVDLEQVKQTLIEQINSNNELSEKERETLKDSIDELESDMENNFDDIKEKIESDIKNEGIEQTETLNNAVENINISISDLQKQVTELNVKLRDYLDNTVIPNVLALIEINSGNIKSLQQNFNEFSVTYVGDKETYNQSLKNIEEKIKNLSDTGDINLIDINTELTKINTVMNEYITENNAALEELRTTNEKEIEKVKEKINVVNEELKRLFNENLEELKVSLIKQINDDRELSEKEREILRNSISQLETDTAKNFDDLRKKIESDLENAGIEQTEALNNAIKNINVSVSDLQKQVSENKTNIESLLQTRLDEIKKSFKEQIDANATLDALEKEELLKAVDSLDTKTAENLDTVRESLNKYMKENGIHSDAVDSAIEDMNLSITNIWNAINTNTSSITSIQKDLNGCTISYNAEDGHFYITKDGVTKKLDFAQ